MKKTYRAFAVVLIVVLAASFLYLSDSRKSIFTEKVGDMTLSRYDTGDVAAQKISIVKQAVMEIS
jgi:hypoxanthine-guanine phosphoribosyltransferase